MVLFRNMVGKKIVMSLSGLAMIIFVSIHLLGNISFYSGADAINAYAYLLHSLGPFLWLVRLVMSAALCLHACLAIQLTLENHAAKSDKYAVRKSLTSTLAGKSMIWTGLLTGGYLIYHLLHLTFGIIPPELSAGRNPDAMGRPDVFMMLMQNFRYASVSSLYILAMAAVGLHLSHGIQSMFQTLGLNNENTLPVIIRIGGMAAILLFIGYISIPVSILSGMVGR